jgi:adenosylmethionine-8-amino-7-oxononanoate aminotransferase
MSHVIHRRLAAPPVSCLGHGHPEIRAAIHAQVDAIAYAHTGFFSSAPAEALAEHLAQHARLSDGRNDRRPATLDPGSR